MKIAFFSDLHGNEQAMNAILADIEAEQVDLTIFAGDAVNPLPGSERVWREIRRRQIPMLLGNHEEYMLDFYAPDSANNGRNPIQFLPTSSAAQRLPTDIIADIKALPLTLTIAGPDGNNILVCHGSPTNTRRSFSQGIDAQMAADLAQCAEAVIVGGHHHIQWQQQWHGQVLMTCGSGGLPLNGSATAQYLLLTYLHGGWHPEHRQLPYDLTAALRELREDGFLDEGGPIAWLIYDELWTADFRMVPFLTSLRQQQSMPGTMSDWRQQVRAYLESLGRWGAIGPLVGWK
jgi:predicted phosphodiesterase